MFTAQSKTPASVEPTGACEGVVRWIYPGRAGTTGAAALVPIGAKSLPLFPRFGANLVPSFEAF